jgi:short-subunit dehydrogenase
MGFLNGANGSIVYNASKAYVNYFTTAMAFELRDKIDI